MKPCRVGHLKADAVLHIRLFRVASGNGHRFGVNISAPDLILAVVFLVHGLISRLEPHSAPQPLPLLGGKAPVQAGGTVFGDEGGLDGNGARAAEGVAEGVLPPVAGQEHHGRRQGLPQGGGHSHRPVAPLVEPRPGSVQHQGHLVVHDGELHLIQRPGLRQGCQAVFLPQPGGQRLFQDGLAGGHRVELGI